MNFFVGASLLEKDIELSMVEIDKMWEIMSFYCINELSIQFQLQHFLLDFDSSMLKVLREKLLKAKSMTEFTATKLLMLSICQK